jgi:hypothetical protein
MMAGLLSGVLAGATLATPAIVAATPATASLTSAEQAIAAKLAESIVTTVMTAKTETRGLPDAEAKLRIQLAIQAVIRNSGATPTVADAALEIATNRLKSQGVLECISPKDKEESCTPAGAALASLSALLKGIVETTPASTNTRGGPIAITAPVGLTPPNSGNAVRFSAVTPPTTPPTTPPVDDDDDDDQTPTTPQQPPSTGGGSVPIGDPVGVTPPGGGSSDYRGS